MILNVLTVGDVVGEQGLDFLTRHLRALQKLHDIHFTVVNGENASGVGILPRQARAIYDAGADVVTLGNHTWNRIQIKDLLPEAPWLLRPAKYTSRVPGRGLGIYDGPRGLRIAVMNLIGRCEMDSNFDNPFTVADRLLHGLDADVCLVDFHAEATSEKGAMGFYLDGRVQAVWGTHTHVPTADAKVLPRGTGFLTDLGMTGPAQSVLGMRPEQAVNRFLGGLPMRFEPAPGPCKLESAVFSIDTDRRRCVGVERVDVGE
ncbi:TIGR00282 family metallophosphoesterase [Intestinimonas sp. RTP31139st1_F5_RTP31139_211217]|uniref:TIGR00282 family metallophosphoesterase n=1 Tax=Intestinimonas sp. RTP31139st1_F5_RTP31139_211217 TaxID=3143190 RepID=UPI0032EF0DAC